MRNVLFWGIGKYSGLSNLEFEMKQNRSFRNICSIYLCPKKVHGILLIESYIIQRLNVEKKNKKNKGTKNIKHTYMMKKKKTKFPRQEKKISCSRIRTGDLEISNPVRTHSANLF